MTATLKNKNIRVLYLDDEENNLRSFKAAFRRDYDIYTAETPENAFEIVKAVKPHVVFSDQRMPGTSGVEFFNAVRQVFPDPVRILITGFTDVDAIIKAINRGNVYRYITKPWSEHEIRMAVENAYDLYTTRRALDQKVEELEKSNHELSSFIYRASHDLRGPIASSLGLIKVAQYEVQDKLALDYLKKIEESGRGLDVLVSNIVDFYKNSRQQELVDEVDFEEVLEEVMDSIHHDIRNFKADIKTNTEQKAAFRADSFRLRIILTNLLTNAIKFKKKEQEKARVDIQIRVDDNEAVIEVRDEGVGIGPEQREKIFDIFFKGNNQQSGSGIGLYIVKEALGKMGGTIKVESRIGESTLFLAKIPNQR